MGSRHARSLNYFGLAIVPQQHAYVVEHFGRYHRTLGPGLNFFIPLIQRVIDAFIKVAYKQSLKEKSHDMKHQNAVTKENVPIAVDGVLYWRIVDAYKASYGAVDAEKYTLKLAQSITRSEIGKLSLDETFSARASTNSRILASLQHATESWGIECIRYEIKDIKVSERVKKVTNKG
jgi:regulator of protease activity HflC (stomatin/prohibitin superfamily)